MRRLALLLALTLFTAVPAVAEAAPRSGLVARPAAIDFRTKPVGSENYKKTRIVNRTGRDVRLVVTAGLPDDFGFGLLPGETCPVFAPGELLPAGASCDAVVRFSPTAGFIGWRAEGTLLVTATDPVSGAPVAELQVPVYGEAVP